MKLGVVAQAATGDRTKIPFSSMKIRRLAGARNRPSLAPIVALRVLCQKKATRSSSGAPFVIGSVQVSDK